jgi:hypothetical protein
LISLNNLVPHASSLALYQLLSKIEQVIIFGSFPTWAELEDLPWPSVLFDAADGRPGSILRLFVIVIIVSQAVAV